jgi:hypothetical protein
MPRELQRATVAAVQAVLPDATLTFEDAPPWLLRPGKAECKARWSLVRSIYEQLTGLDLPDVMPSRESRRADAMIQLSGQLPRILEFDESQHFNVHRATTLLAYPADVEIAFPRERWLFASESSTRKLGTTGGWGRAKPPLFPQPGGRHMQRAFRDALADLLPAEHGWAPTLRIADFEVQEWIDDPRAVDRMRELLAHRL